MVWIEALRRSEENNREVFSGLSSQPNRAIEPDLELLGYHPRRNWLDYVKRCIPNLLARIGFK